MSFFSIDENKPCSILCRVGKTALCWEHSNPPKLCLFSGESGISDGEAQTVQQYWGAIECCREGQGQPWLLEASPGPELEMEARPSGEGWRGTLEWQGWDEPGQC